MAKKISLNSILDVIRESWGLDKRNGMPYSGKAVREAIQGKLAELDIRGGYLYMPNEKSDDGYYSLWVFQSKEKFDEWTEDPERYVANVLQKLTIPISTDKGTTYSARLFVSRPTGQRIVAVEKDFRVGVRYCGVATTDGIADNVGVQGRLSIQRSTDNGNTWSEVGYQMLASRDLNATGFVDEVNLGEYFVQGGQQMRMRVSYVMTDDDGGVIANVVSSWQTFTSLSYTELGVLYAGQYEMPIKAKDFQNLTLQYKMRGGVARTLHLKITSDKGEHEWTYGIGAGEYTNYSDQNIKEIAVVDDTSSYGLLEHGVKTVEAWLTCDNGQGETLESEHVVNQLMVVADEEDTTPRVLIQNLKREVVNYEAVTLFDYAVYAPGAEDVALKFALTDYYKSERYFETETRAVPLTKNSLVTTVEIENSVDDEVSAYLHVTGENGAVYADGDMIAVDNRQKFAPTAGAVFWLNPKVRNNKEEKRFSIVNAVNGETVGAKFENFDAQNDLWVADEDGQRVLRVLAGQKLTIDVDWLRQFKPLSGGVVPQRDVTLEMVVKTRNVTNEDEPILTAADYYVNGDKSKYMGLEMCPLVGHVYTASNVTERAQRFVLEEDVKSHIAVNIVSNMQPDASDTEHTLAVCRIFQDGNNRKEFTFDKTKQEWYSKGSKIIIGQDHADIDIYSIRIYEKPLSGEQIQQNYISTLPTSELKKAYRAENDIKGDDGFIALDRVRQKGKNAIITHAKKRVYAYSTTSTTGWVEIHIYDERGNYLPEFSGTLCKETQTLPIKGQGTTAKTYYYWNEQYNIKDVEALILVEVKNLHEDVIRDMFGGEVTSDKIIEKEGKQYVEVVDGWIDGNGMYRGNRYLLQDGVNYANKLVKKINYASSMQSHLMGANNAYNDLYMVCVGRPEFQKRDGNTKARVTKPSRAFFDFYSRIADDGTENGAVYQGGCTFGPGKMDEGTLGFNKKKHTNFAMIEGSDNNMTLTDFRCPWESKYITEDIDTQENEVVGWKYNGVVSIDLDKFVKVKGEDGISRPNETVMRKIKEFVNFNYMHDTGIKVYVGEFSGTNNSFLSSEDSADHNHKWWCTSGAEAYKLKRWHEVLGQWVDAGWDAETETIQELNLNTAYPNAVTSAIKGKWDRINDAFIGAIAKDASAELDKADAIINKKSLIFYKVFVDLFLCGSDNFSKNTYYVLDPYTLQWYLWADDMDTIFATDNNGFDTKPYYIERLYAAAEGTSVNLYEGMYNAMFNMEQSICDNDGSNRGMAASILTAMCGLVGDGDYLPWFSSDKSVSPQYGTDNKKSVWGFYWKYFFSIQKYFPDIAYNEQARIRYEYPESLGFRSTLRQVAPISQNMGNALSAELLYMRRRLVYVASYAEWGDFAWADSSHGGGVLGLDEAKDVLGLQAFVDIDGKDAFYRFEGLVPHQYIYPSGVVGTTTVGSRMRCKPGQSYTFDLTQGKAIKGDTGTKLCGINFYRSLGNLGDMSANPSADYKITAKRLTEFVAEPTDAEKPQFRPLSIIFDTPLLERLSLKGCSRIGGTLDLAGLSRVRSVDLRGCRRILNVHFPSSSFLTEAHVNDGIRNIVLKEQPNLGDLTFEGYSGVETVEIRNNSAFDSRKFIVDLYNAKTSVEGSAEVERIVFDRISWEGVSLNLLRWLLTIEDFDTAGRITLMKSDNYTLTIDDKIALGRKFGNIDNPANKLYIVYELKPLASVSIKMDDYIRKPGLYTGAKLQVQPKNANNLRIDEEGRLQLKWSLPEDAYEYAEIADEISGTINVKKLSDPEDKLKFEVKCEMDAMEERDEVKIIGYANLEALTNGDDSNVIFYNRYGDLSGRMVYGINIYTNNGAKVEVWKIKYVSYGGAFTSKELLQTFYATKQGVNTFYLDTPVTLGENEVVGFNCPNGGAYFGRPSGESYAKENRSWSDQQSAYNLIEFHSTTSLFTATSRVGFWDRIPEVGDFAYGDGSFSDEYNPEKDWIGWVFKKDKVDGGYLIRVVSVHSAVRDYMWYGLVLQGGTQWNSILFRITQAQKEEIQDGIGMQVAPLAVYTPKSLGIKSCEDLIDESADDGFKSVAGNVAAGVYVGKMWTDEAIKVAKGTFAYANEPFPNTISELAGLLEKYKDDPQKQCMFYPIFTYAYLYEPKAGSPLHPSYRKNKWYVPSWGEALLFMLFFLNSQGKGRELWKGVNEDINDLDSPKKDALRPYVSNLIRKIHEVKPGLSIPTLKCDDFCCAEYTTDGNGVVEIGDRYSFSEGRFYEKDIKGVQPCCQFFYESNS